MYPAPWATLPQFVAHDWIRHSGETRLSQVAESMCDAAGIRDGDILVGSSLGGMVACEIAKIRRIPALFLLGSATRKEEISALLAALHPFARVAPIDWLRISAGKVPNEFAQMFAEADSSFMRAMCAAIFEWEGLGASPTKVYRLHGKYDLVIPPPPNPDLLLDGGHVIAVSHAYDCSEFVRARSF